MTAEARRNLSDLLLVTERQWGQRQRTAHRASLMSVIHHLAQFPDLGRSREELAVGLRALLVAPHIVYYRVDDRTVTVVRILLQRMDATGTFEDSP